MVQLCEGAFAALSSVAQRRDEEAVGVQGGHGSSGGVGDVLALTILDVVGMAAARDTQLLGLLATVRAEEGLPVVGDAEDDVGAAEGFEEGCGVVEVGGNGLDALVGQLASGW